MPIANINQVNLNYEVVGEGFPLVICHGYTGSIEDWDLQIPALSKKYKVVAMDHRGHGGSRAPSSPSDYSVPIFARDVYGLLQHLGINQCYLMGHSMGGFIALELVLAHPELVSALILVDTSSGDYDRPPGFEELRARLDELARTEGMEAAFEYNASHNPMTIDRLKKHPEMREIMRQRTLKTSVDGYIYAARAIGQWQPVTDRLAEIKVPTLIFVGDEDQPFIKPSQTLEAGIPGARLVVVPGVGHSPHEEAPEVFSQELLSFLAGVEPR